MSDNDALSMLSCRACKFRNAGGLVCDTCVSHSKFVILDIYKNLTSSEFEKLLKRFNRLSDIENYLKGE